MSLLSLLGRTAAIATVVVGIALLTLAVQGVTRVDARLELAATQQQQVQQPALRFADCPFQHRDRGHDRRDV